MHRGRIRENKAACPWLSGRQSISARVNEVLQRMTPLEESSLLHLHPNDGSVPYEGYSDPIPALCIPRITEQDGAAGVATNFSGVTQLPAPITDAAAFDPALARSYGSVIGAEDATKGIDLALSPTVNIERDPLWGRSYETLGEDPFLTAVLAPQLVQGIQSHRVVSVVKHYTAYSQELHRDSLLDNSIVSERALREIYLPPFATAVAQGHAGGMMCAYNSVNGVPVCQSRPLLDTVLRGQLHFGGFIRSDCGSVYRQQGAMQAGVSQVKCSPYYNPRRLADAVFERALSRSTLNDLARPLLTVLFRYNLIAKPHPETYNRVATSAAHRAVALRTADEGAVLLKNAGHLLPLDFRTVPSVALIGPDGGTPMPAGYGAMYVQPSHPVDALTALRQRLGARLRYSTGESIGAAVQLARSSRVAVVVVNDVEAERMDRTTLALSAHQDALVRAVANANPRTVVVLETGSAVLLPWLSRVRSVLETWYPGEVAGTSLAQLLSGQADPSGKLPVTFPASEQARPDTSRLAFGGVGGRVVYSEGIDVGYRWYQIHHVRPLFSFGYGLSYTTFRFSHFSVQGDSQAGITVRVEVTNTGHYRGADVVQGYIGDPAGTGEAPRQLKAFERVTLAPGHSRLVRMVISPSDLAQWDTRLGQWRIAAGTYRIYVGDGSALSSLPLHTSMPLTAEALGTDAGPGLTGRGAPLSALQVARQHRSRVPIPLPEQPPATTPWSSTAGLLGVRVAGQAPAAARRPNMALGRRIQTIAEGTH